MSEMFGQKRKVALLTGALKRMGFAIATAFAQHGAKIFISAGKIDRLKSAAKEISIACNVDLTIQKAAKLYMKWH